MIMHSILNLCLLGTAVIVAITSLLICYVGVPAVMEAVIESVSTTDTPKYFEMIS